MIPTIQRLANADGVKIAYSATNLPAQTHSGMGSLMS
jgi:hypothetical protein